MNTPRIQPSILGILVLIFALVPSIVRATDIDGNGFEDEREQFLVNRFCPCLLLEAADKGVCPEPVEIMTNHLWASYYGGWDTTEDYLGEVRDLPDEGTNYSWIDNEHPVIHMDPPFGGPTINCGFTPVGRKKIYHFDFGGRGEWCGEESRDHNDQPTEATGDDWYTVYKNGNEWTQPGSAFANTVYAHPFTYQDGLEGLTHVIQYWFFYPFDDWVKQATSKSGLRVAKAATAGAGIDGDGMGPLLDDHAKGAYRARANELRDDIAEAERNNDLSRLVPLRDELSMIEGQLAAAIGFGGRQRPTGDLDERARKSAGSAVRAALRVIHSEHPVLHAHLKAHLKTGTYCCYSPNPPVTWSL